MRFFLDNNISHRLAAALIALDDRVERGDWTVEHLRVRFNQQTEDVTWLEALGREGEWILISGDIRISRNRAERAAWRESGLTAFFSLANIQKRKSGPKLCTFYIGGRRSRARLGNTGKHLKDLDM